MSSKIYIEGGGDSKDLKIRCREGFHRLLARCEFKGRPPRPIPCGGRNGAFDKFKTALSTKATGDHVWLWIDSEDPVADVNKTWAHLNGRDGWTKPRGAADDHVLLMTTCMETLILTDRNTLQIHYGSKLQQSGLPPLNNIEARSRGDVQAKLAHATRNCTNAYNKGKRSFEILGKLDPTTLEKHLPSFARTRRILNEKLH